MATEIRRYVRSLGLDAYVVGGAVRDELAVDLHVVHAPVGLERRAETRLVEPRDEEVLVCVRDPEQLVTHRPADDPGVLAGKELPRELIHRAPPAEHAPGSSRCDRRARS